MQYRKWNVGSCSVTLVIELTNVRDPSFVFPALTREEVTLQSWMLPDFSTPDGRLISRNQAFIVDTGTRRIIVDTCVGNDKQRRNERWNGLTGSFLQDLADAGYPAESIDTVICTHMHVDHVGWNTRLVDGVWVPTFPNASYLFGNEEWAHWSQEIEGLDGDVPPNVAENILESRQVYRDSVLPILEAGQHRLVATDYRITDEVYLIPTPGHTPGHVSVGIFSGGEQAVITGDIMHHPIQCSDPSITSCFDYDIARARMTRDAFIRSHSDRPILIFGTHFAGFTAGYIRSHERGWRFVEGSDCCSARSLPSPSEQQPSL